MAILFDGTRIRDRRTNQRKKNPPRIIANGQMGTDELRSEIQWRCTLNEVDITAVLNALSQVMGKEMSEDRQVHLDGIWYFYPTLTARKKSRQIHRAKFKK